MDQSQYMRKYSKGTVIAREGDTGSEMNILQSGIVGVYKTGQSQNQVLTATLGSGRFFGEMSLFLGKPHPATIVALGETIALVVTKQNALEVFGKQPDLAYSILGELCNRVDTLNQAQPTAQAAGSSVAANPTPAQPTPSQSTAATRPATSSPSKVSSLFPEKHGSYTLPALTSENDCLYLEKFTCPLCKSQFESIIVLTSRLRRTGTDRDLHIRYADVEPIYYDIVSCPNCLFSALNDSFTSAARSSHDRVVQALGKYKPEVQIKTGLLRDTFTVFAGYYLALLCSPICFDNHQMINAGLWRKLASLYKDCEDNSMFLYASEKALQEYNHVYECFDLSDGQMQQICYILGDLHERLKDYEKARNFFFMVKTGRGGTRNMQYEAENRLEDLKELMKDNE